MQSHLLFSGADSQGAVSEGVDFLVVFMIPSFKSQNKFNVWGNVNVNFDFVPQSFLYTSFCY